MAITRVQDLGTAQEKVADTTLSISVASLTITSGNDVFVGVSSDDISATAITSITDNLGNTYAEEHVIRNAGQVNSYLWRAPVTTGGTLTTIDITFDDSPGAKAAVAAEFSGVGARVTTHGFDSDVTTTLWDIGTSYTVDGVQLTIAALGSEGPASDTFTVDSTNSFTGTTSSGNNGTSGGGAASNIKSQLSWAIGPNETRRIAYTINNARDIASASAVYDPESVGPSEKLHWRRQNVPGYLQRPNRAVYA